jgi:hypothetical protein
MRANNLYESINSGLSKLVEGTLNEANREFTPEEKADLELIRSAIRKKRDKASKAYINKAEKDALARRGFKIDGKKFETPGGYIKTDWDEPEINDRNGHTRRYRNYYDSEGKYIPKSRIIGGKSSESSWAEDYGEPNVNLIDMAPKQEERKKNQIVDTDYSWRNDGYLLPERKKKKGSGKRQNRLDAERYEQNYNLSRNYKQMKDMVRARQEQKEKIPGVYRQADRDKEYYLEKIKQYKDALRAVDDNAEQRVAQIGDTVARQTREMRRFLDDRKNKKKTESLHIRRGRKNAK